MLTKQDEQKLMEWTNRQIRNVKDKLGIEISPDIIRIDMDKTLLQNRDSIAAQIKEKILLNQGVCVQDTTIKQEKVKSPFKHISTAQYKNILAQIPDSTGFTPKDVGEDATEENAINYFRDNCGITVKSLEETIASVKEQAKADKQKAEHDYLEYLHKQKEEADFELEQKASLIMKDGGCPLLNKAETIYNYFKEQNLGCEHITLVSQFSLFGLGTKFLFEGAAGIGKSRSDVEQIERFMQELKDNHRIKILSGHLSPLQMYEILYNYKEHKDLLVIDEGFFVVNDDKIQQMFRDAQFRGKVYWQSKSKLAEHLPPEFDYNGSIVINANMFGKKNNPNAAAFMDRLITFKVVLSNEEIIQKIQSSRTFQFNQELEIEMVNRITAIRSGQVSVEVTEQDKDFYYGLLANEVKFLSKDFSNISFRTLQKCELIYKCFKLYFGGFNQFTKDWYADIAKQVIKGNTTENFIIATMQRTGGQIKASELSEIIQEHFGCKRTQSYEYIKQLKEAGMIEGSRTLVVKTVMAQ